MIDFSQLKTKFDDVSIIENRISTSNNLLKVLSYLKEASEFSFGMLTSIVAVDLTESIELIYQLYSVDNNEVVEVSYITKTSVAPSVINIFPSANFDECEIYDLFGINFEGNESLKRLFLPDSWIGHPLLKSYSQKDERLVWND